MNGVLARIAPLGWHVVLHLDAEDIGTYRGFLDGLRVPFVIDHMGRVRGERTASTRSRSGCCSS